MQGVRYVRLADVYFGVRTLAIGALAAAAILGLAPVRAGATPLKPGSSPDSRSGGRANPSLNAFEGAPGLALGFRPAVPSVPAEVADAGDHPTAGFAGLGPDAPAGDVAAAPSPVPEPSSLLVFGAGLLAVGQSVRGKPRN